MAEKKQQQYPVRLNIGGPKVTAAPPREDPWRRAIQNSVGQALPIPAIRFAKAMALKGMRDSSGGEMPPVAAAAAMPSARTAAPGAKQSLASPLMDALAQMFPGMKGISLNQLGAFSGALPKPGDAPSAKDNILGAAQEAFTQQFAADVAQAKKTGAIDAAAGVEAERGAVEKYLARAALFAGGDPYGLQAIAPPKE